MYRLARDFFLKVFAYASAYFFITKSVFFIMRSDMVPSLLTLVAIAWGGLMTKYFPSIFRPFTILGLLPSLCFALIKQDNYLI